MIAMSEANTPINPDLPEPNEPNNPMGGEPMEYPAQDSQTAEDEWETVNFPHAMNVDALEELSLYAQATGWDPEPQESAPPDLPPLAAQETQNLERTTDPRIVIEALSDRNTELVQRITQLETVVQECRTTLEWHRRRSENQETLLEQKTEELTAAQAEVTRLQHEVEVSQQGTQRQQILIETLTQQLESTQERLAQMERECAITQQRYNQQSHQLQQTESVCRELRSRLHRQQRQTLQFKAALEKCLDVPAPNSSGWEAYLIPPPPETDALWMPEEPTTEPAGTSGSVPVAPKAQPIQPWRSPSATPEEKITPDTKWQKPDPEPSPQSLSFTIQASDAEKPQPSQTEPPAAIAPTPPSAIKPETQELTPVAETREAIEPPQGVESAEPITPPRDSGSLGFAATSNHASPKGTANEPNWPAPVVYPLHPPKKRQSLAAVELPSFPKTTDPES